VKRRCSILSIGGLLVAALALPGRVAAEDPEARALVQRTKEALPREPFTARVRLSGDVRSDRELSVRHKVVDGERATYLEAVAPEHLVGMRFLFRERPDKPPLQYMRYIASTMPVLISREMAAERFLGSTFYLADIAEPDLDAFTYTFVGEETINGRPCKLVESVAKDPNTEVYGKVVHAIDAKDLIVVRRRFFDKSGKPIKQWSADKIEKVEGYWTVRDQRMKMLTGNEESRIEMTEIDYGTEIDDSIFTKEYLVRK
jgi:hypothetical protein